jgi:hypothetical protein
LLAESKVWRLLDLRLVLRGASELAMRSGELCGRDAADSRYAA